MGAAGLRDPRILFPFLLITLIWSSTWIVIKDQLGSVPAVWSVSYRFFIAAAVMFIVAGVKHDSLAIGRDGHRLAVVIGLLQFCLNFNFVYAAEHHVTSGLVAVVFALLIVPNTLLARFFHKEEVTRTFVLGSAVALAGVALLFAQEMRGSDAANVEVLVGIAYTMGGVLAASGSNVLQLSQVARARPIASMLAWAMLYGAAMDGAFALVTRGPPVFEPRLGYWLGLAYLGVVASALAFLLYFAIIRKIGAGRAAYSSVLVPIIAMAISTIAEGYVWSALSISGGALAIFGLVIALRSGPPR